MGLQVWNGSSFVDGAPKVWNGSAFVDPQSIHVWDGAGFQQVWPSFSSGVTMNSASAGAYTTNDDAAATKTVTFTIDVQPGGNRVLYVVGAGGGSAWSDGYTLSASSSLDGALTAIGKQDFGNSSGYRQGTMGIFKLVDPSVGVHTITVSVGFWNGVNRAMGTAVCFDGVGGEGPLQYQATTSSASQPNLALAGAETGDMILAATASSSFIVPTGSWSFLTPPELVYNGGASVAGQCDVLRVGFVAGDGATKTFSSSTSVHHCTMALRIIQAS